MKNTIRFIFPLFILLPFFAQKSFADYVLVITAPAFDSSVMSNLGQPTAQPGFDPMAYSNSPGSYGAAKRKEAERAKACADAKSAAETAKLGCLMQASDKRDKAVAKCPQDTEVVVGIPGVITATTTPRASCKEDAGDIRATDELKCNYDYSKAIPSDCPK
jgi:hypothetical protein